MFFYLSKLFWIAASPANALVGLALLGLGLGLTRWARFGRRLALGSLVLLVMLGILPVSTLLVRPLEDRFPAFQEDGRPVDGIVILGGAIGIARGQPSFNDLASRMTEAVALARRHPQAKIVFAGGDGHLLKVDDLTEADGARLYFRAMGIADERVIYEDQSRNTRENALFTSRLVQPRPGERWLLVTSAFHMPRAMGCFRAVGWNPVPYPVDYRSEDDARDLKPNRSLAGGLAALDLVVKEWIGLIAYRMAGYTSDLLPSP